MPATPTNLRVEVGSRLVHSNNVSYQYSFKLPNSSVAFSGCQFSPIAYNPVNNSLFIACAGSPDPSNLGGAMEISIPPSGGQANEIQPYTDIFEGHVNDAVPGGYSAVNGLWI